MLKTVDQFEYINEDTIADELRCIICAQPFQLPVTTNCLHTFCQQCIETWLQQNDSCPICRHTIQTQLLLVNNKSNLLLKQLDSLLVRCLICKKNDIKRVDFEEHLKRCLKKKKSNIFRKSWRSLKTIIKPKTNRPTVVTSSPSVTYQPQPIVYYRHVEEQAFHLNLNLNQRIQWQPVSMCRDILQRISTLFAAVLFSLAVVFIGLTLIGMIFFGISIFLFCYSKLFRQILCIVFIILCCLLFGKITLSKLFRFIKK